MKKKFLKCEVEIEEDKNVTKDLDQFAAKFNQKI